ncbi:MAG: hypothetical protein IPJ93_16250 [Bacteroidota bacterium]|nr:MAG: hypothetical protein IPJ93_16250 [Bacteroidota bacterium]
MITVSPTAIHLRFLSSVGIFFLTAVSLLLCRPKVAYNSQIYEVPNAIKEAGKKIAILQ